MGAEQFEAVIAAVVDDDVRRCQGLEMGERGGALVAVGEEVEIDGQLGVQAVQAAQQALRVVRLLAGQGVAGRQQRAGQVQLRAVDGEDAVAVPEGAGLVLL